MTDSSRRNEAKADIVDRLRDVSRGGWPDADEAAAEIERLRATLDRIGVTEMTDIVARLRQAATPGTPVGELFTEAVGEIERLRAALQAITDHFASVMDGPMIRGAGIEFKNGVEGIPTIARARAALGQT
jgi:hypothetical protein